MLAAYFTSAGRPYGFQCLLHVAYGYTVILLVIFRLVWGLVGGEHARFAAFMRGWEAVRAHARSLVRLTPQRALGHNPIGGWMIVLMLATVALIVVTGLMAQGKAGGRGPLTALIPQAAVTPIGAVHKFLGTAILFLAGFHVLGVVAESLLLRANLTRAMVTGRKSAERPDARDTHAAPAWRGIVLAALLAIVGFVMASITTIPERPLATSEAPAPSAAQKD